jgi:imidazolonepropionase-like amidohydrolase
MVCAGTDAGVPHVRHGALPHELEGLARLGLGLPDVLRAATTFAARALGWDDIGSFRPGAHADLAVLASNPLEDAGAYHRVTRTIKSAEIVA